MRGYDKNAAEDSIVGSYLIISMAVVPVASIQTLGTFEMRPYRVIDLIDLLRGIADRYGPDEMVMASVESAESATSPVEPDDWKAFCEFWTHDHAMMAANQELILLESIGREFYESRAAEDVAA